MSLENQNTIVSTPICLRTTLRKEFLRRCKSNPAYSLRAFAKFLHVDQSLLSKWMSGQRAISKKMIEHVAPKLGLKPSQIDTILMTSQFINTSQSLPHIDYQQMADDEVSLLAEWSHFAILELIKTSDFKMDIKWMAERLNLHTQEVTAAIERLERMGFIAISDHIQLLRPNNQWNNTAATTVARQELQKSLLTKAQEALETVPFNERENGSLTVAIKKSRMPEFKEKLKQMRDELDAFFQPDTDANDFDEVYQLTVAFFPITKKNLKSKNLNSVKNKNIKNKLPKETKK